MRAASAVRRPREGEATRVNAERVARERFRAEYPRAPQAELAVVIAAYNEEANLGSVLTAIPAEVCGQRTVALVVVDGCADDTAGVARRHGALVADLPVNCGQGTALRVGYALARQLGVRFIATLDADGQYPPSDLPAVVEPLVAGRADFVSGSRKLGRAEAPTLLRRVGTVVFAALLSVLVRQRITDTSNGLRAMRAEVTADVLLRQPQYQAAELLISVLAAGYRVVEVPTVLRRRHSGRSKKGPNLLYGYHFAAVILGTWWRERVRHRGAAGSGRSQPLVLPSVQDDAASGEQDECGCGEQERVG